jgi:hypothetical protein
MTWQLAIAIGGALVLGYVVGASTTARRWTADYRAMRHKLETQVRQLQRVVRMHGGETC